MVWKHLIEKEMQGDSIGIAGQISFTRYQVVFFLKTRRQNKSTRVIRSAVKIIIILF